MTLKKTDFTISRGIEKLQYKRGVSINEKTTNLMVVLVKNHNKGTYSIEIKWNSEQISEHVKDDAATLQTLIDLAAAAAKDGKIWRKEWHDNQPKDEDQMSMSMPE